MSFLLDKIPMSADQLVMHFYRQLVKKWIYLMFLGVFVYGAGYFLGTQYRHQERGLMAYEFLHKTERIPAQIKPTESR